MPSLNLTWSEANKCWVKSLGYQFNDRGDRVPKYFRFSYPHDEKGLKQAQSELIPIIAEWQKIKATAKATGDRYPVWFNAKLATPSKKSLGQMSGLLIVNQALVENERVNPVKQLSEATVEAARDIYLAEFDSSGANSRTKTTQSATLKYCLTCGYDLRGQQVFRCPECGRTFDAADPRTFSRRRPRSRLFLWFKYSAITLILLLMFLTGAYAWLWYGWKTEQKANANLPRSIFEVSNAIGGYKLQEMLGSQGYILERYSVLHFVNNKASDASMAHVAKLTHLRELWVPGVTDAGMEKIKELRSVQDLNLSHSKVSNAGLEYLSGFSDLQDLSLGSADVTDLRSLIGLKKLQRLYVSDCKISNSGLAPVGQIGSLSHIDIMRTLVTDEGLRAFAGLSALESLDLSFNQIQGPGLFYLQKLPHLTFLYLGYTDIRDNSLSALEGFHELVCLDLSGNVLTDKALPNLAKLENLQLLDLSLTFITDRGLSEFKTMRRLKELTLSKSEVTEAGVRKLQRQRPDLEVIYEPSSPNALRWDRLLQTAQTSNMPPVIDLQLLANPPVKPRCELVDLPEGSGPRRYMAFDLNDDGSTEYFVENFTCDDEVTFALVDSKGRPLVGPYELRHLAGERLIILYSKHYGYYDILSYDCDPAACRGGLWQFDGKSYVCARTFEFDMRELNKVLIDRIPGTARARWYSVPPCESWDFENE